MRCLALSFVAVLATALPVHAQQKHNASQPQHQAAAPQMHFPNNTVHFPNNTMNFPNNTVNFPNNAFHFPNNSVINFPSQAYYYAPPTLNFPNNTVNFPSYNSAIYSHVVPFNTGINTNNSAANLNAQANQASALMGIPFGVGNVYHAAPHHYSSGYHPSHYRTPYRTSVAHRTGTNLSNQMTPTQRHYVKVVHDLDSLTPHFQVADTHRRMFANDLMALSEGNIRPSIQPVQQLAANLANGMSRRQNQTFNTALLTDGLRIALNGSHIPAPNVNQAINQTQTLLKEAGFTNSDIKTVVADLHAVVADARTRSGQANNVNVR